MLGRVVVGRFDLEFWRCDRSLKRACSIWWASRLDDIMLCLKAMWHLTISRWNAQLCFSVLVIFFALLNGDLFEAAPVHQHHLK